MYGWAIHPDFLEEVFHSYNTDEKNIETEVYLGTLMVLNVYEFGTSTETP